MPKATALALSVACTALAGGLLIGGWMIPGMAVLVASFAFDILFVLAQRAENRERS